ncbi:Hypothetical predicted protein, partial [Paramuricea clavata]
MTDQKTFDNLRITDHKNLTRRSFGFTNNIHYEKFDSKKLMISTREGRTLLFRISDCSSPGVRRSYKYGMVQLSAPIRTGEEIASVLDVIGEKCYKKIKGEKGNAMSCLSRNGDEPVLYTKLDDETLFFDGNGERVGHREYRDRPFQADSVVIRIESVF